MADHRVATGSRPLRWPVTSLLVAISLVGPGVWFYWRTPQEQRAFLAVELGMTREVVRYQLGSPPYLLDVYGTCANGGQAVFTTIADPENTPLPRGRSDLDFDDWTYGDTDNRHSQEIHFEHGVVVGIGCFDFLGQARTCPTVHGVRTGDSEEQVRRQLGAARHETVDSGVKFMRYPQYGISLRLEKGRVYGVIVGRLSSPADAQPPPAKMMVASS